MKRPIFIYATALILIVSCSAPKKSNDIKGQKWISIFNGENLDGWTPKFAGHDLGVNYKNTFRVEEGLLKVSYENYDEFNGKFGHLFYKVPYSHYRIRAEYRFTGKQVPGAPDWAWRNNGLKLHSQPPQTMGKNQPSPVSIEVQLLGGSGKEKRTTANMCSMGTHVEIDGELITQHCLNSNSQTYHGDQWVTVEAELNGSKSIHHYVNGKKVITYHNPQYDTTDSNARRLLAKNQQNVLIDRGYIAIQAESHPTQFRSIEILPLEKNKQDE